MSIVRAGSLVIDIDGCSLSPEDNELLTHPLVGGVILFSRNYESIDQLSLLTDAIRDIAPDLLITVDHEGGRVQRFRDMFTRLPSAQTVRTQYESTPEQGLQIAFQTGWLIGAELASVGIDLSFTPVLDIDFNTSEVIGDRAYGADTETIVTLTTELGRGLTCWGFSLVGKHFPGHGNVVADSHLELPIDTRVESEIFEKDLLPFAQLINRGLPALMSAHVIYEQLDSVPATFSKYWLQDVLRDKLGFKGVVFSDDLTMKATLSFGSIMDRYMLAVEAGCDAVLVCNNRQDVELLVDNLIVSGDDIKLKKLNNSHNRLKWGELNESSQYRSFRKQVEQLI